MKRLMHFAIPKSAADQYTLPDWNGESVAPCGINLIRSGITGGPGCGIQVLTLTNKGFGLTIFPTCGFSIGAVQVGDAAAHCFDPLPTGPIHPGNKPDWMDRFTARHAIRCGLVWNGEPENGRCAHGMIDSRPAQTIEIFGDRNSVMIEGILYEPIPGREDDPKGFLRLASRITMTAGVPGIHIQDVVQNLSAEPSTLQYLWHLNEGGVGHQFAREGSRLHVPARLAGPFNDAARPRYNCWDTFPPEDPASDQLFAFELCANGEGKTSALVTDPSAQAGFQACWKVSEFPHFMLYCGPGGKGKPYKAAIEPGTGYWRPQSHELQHNRCGRLGGGAFREFNVWLKYLIGQNAVHAATAEINALRGDVTTTLLRDPRSDW